MDRKKLILLILTFVMVAVVIPIMLDLFIFGNNCPSNIDNNTRASFLGSFLGAIIGGGCTCWAVIMQKIYADEQRRLDEVNSIRPYIVINNPIYSKSGEVIKLRFNLTNIGLNSACGIEMYAIDSSKNGGKEKINDKKYSLAVNKEVELKPQYDFSLITDYELHFNDLKGNEYCQTIKYDSGSNTFTSEEPKSVTLRQEKKIMTTGKNAVDEGK